MTPTEGQFETSSLPSRESRFGQWPLWKRALLGGGFSLLLLGLLSGSFEWGFRLIGIGHSASFFSHLASGEVVENEAFIWSYHGPESPLKPHPFKFSHPKPEDTLRIFVLGESAAMGTPEPAFGFSRILERLLHHRYPDQAFEVINLAMRGINSHMIRRIAMEAAAYEPDLVIVYAGNNELVGWQAPEPDQAPLRPLKMIRAQQALLSTRLGQWLWQRIRPFKDEWNQEQDMAFFRKHHLSAKDPRRRRVLSRFAGNMSEALEVFVVQRVPVLVGSVLVNERDFPPLGFPSSSEATPLNDPLFALPWWQACEGGDREWLEEQLPVLEQYLQNNPQDARAHYLVARAQETLGDFFAAKVHYQAARDADHLPFRATTRINHTLKKLAETMGGVEWVDLETYALRGEEEVKALGDAWFHEHVHFRFEGDYRLAAYFYPHVQQTLKLPMEDVVQEGGQIRPMSEVARDLGYTPISEAMMERSMIDLLSAPPFLDQWMHEERLEERKARWQQRFSIYGKPHVHGALQWIAEASERFPDDWHLPLLASRMADRLQNHALALEWATRARDRMPHASLPQFMMAQQAMALGKKEEARDALEAILHRYPEHPLALGMLEAL